MPWSSTKGKPLLLIARVLAGAKSKAGFKAFYRKIFYSAEVHIADFSGPGIPLIAENGCGPTPIGDTWILLNRI